MTATTTEAMTIEQAVAVARADAATRYKNLERFRVEITLEHDGWHVQYHLKSHNSLGGGPQYIIDANDGRIVSKTYYQ